MGPQNILLKGFEVSSAELCQTHPMETAQEPALPFRLWFVSQPRDGSWAAVFALWSHEPACGGKVLLQLFLGRLLLTYDSCVFRCSDPPWFSNSQTIARVTFIDSEVFCLKSKREQRGSCLGLWCGNAAWAGLMSWMILGTGCCRCYHCLRQLLLFPGTPCKILQRDAHACAFHDHQQAEMDVSHPGQKSRKVILNNVLLLWIYTQELSSIQPTSVKLVLS